MNKRRVEINGDVRLTLVNRIRYLIENIYSNIQGSPGHLKKHRFVSGRLKSTPKEASPGRALTESFLDQYLPKLPLPKKINVLEIGCGSGKLSNILIEAGYEGEYTGIDIQDRHQDFQDDAFARTFLNMDIHEYSSEKKYDLVISISALEHIANDNSVLAKLDDLLKDTGIQLHIVPSGAGLLVYLWHGYRQYSLAAIGEKFGTDNTGVYLLGGFAGFITQFIYITLGEIIFRLNIRHRFPRFYGKALDAGLWLDRYLPFFNTMTVVVKTKNTIQV